jgi:hypothetical protein
MIKSSGLLLVLSLQLQIHAQVELFTDRMLYAAGEPILFSAFLTGSAGQEDSCWSRVLYLNLVTPEGTSVSHGKFPLTRGAAQGYLPVPGQLLTGNYYLTARTRALQNFPPIHHEYRLIKIINPENGALERSSRQRGTPVPPVRRKPETVIEEILSCSTEKARFRPGENIIISMAFPAGFSGPVSEFTVLAGRPAVMDSLCMASVLPDSIYTEGTGNIRYIPEMMGLSISGNVLRKETGAAAGDVLVELSVLGKDPRFLACRTGTDGSFCFALDSMSGTREMFISARGSGGKNLEILVNDGFFSTDFAFTPRPFVLSDAEKEEATRICLNAKLQQRYREGIPVPPGDTVPAKGNFYGIPSSRVMIDEYIKLPNFTEVIIELVPGVQPAFGEERRHLVFAGNRANQPYLRHYPSLLLLDQVPVYDIEKLLTVPPGKLYSIDVVNELYVTGNIIYGGIMSISTRRGDMAGLEPPDNSFFFTFEGFLPQNVLNIHDPSSQAQLDRIPDLRNTQLWLPGLQLSPGQVTEVSLNAPERPGRYLVLVRGYAGEGRILQGRCSFTVGLPD